MSAEDEELPARLEEMLGSILHIGSAALEPETRRLLLTIKRNELRLLVVVYARLYHRRRTEGAVRVLRSDITFYASKP